MKKTNLILLVIILIMSSCNLKTIETEDNQELLEMVKEDQKLRTSDTDEPWEPSDQIRRHRVMELLVNGQIRTDNDKMNAALILQHTGAIFCDGELKSLSPENFYLAYTLAKSAFENGNADAAYFTAATYDRYLLYTEGYQKYGTQRLYENDEEVWAPIDSTTTDEERAKYNVPSLEELLKQYKMKELN